MARSDKQAKVTWKQVQSERKAAWKEAGRKGDREKFVGATDYYGHQLGCDCGSCR